MASEVAQFRCTGCEKPKLFATESELQTHNEKFIDCRKGCGRHFEKPRGEQVHVARAHPVPATPNEPSSLMSTSQPVPSSSIGVSSERPSATQPPLHQHKCSVCGQTFASQQGLASHSASHPAESNRARMARLQASLQPQQATPPEDAAPELDDSLTNQREKWLKEFKEIAADPSDDKRERFEVAVNGFLEFLSEAPSRLPGPKHPATTYYKKRRQRKATVQTAQQSKSTNPQRKDKRAKQRRKEQYQYKVAQFDYAYNRKRVARRAMGEKTPEPCPIPLEDLHKHFETVFAQPNERVLSDYPQHPTREDISVTLDEVNAAIQGISLDTSAGNDRVLSKTIRELKAGAIIREMTEIMLATGWTPEKLCDGRTVLIPKEGDPNDPNNYRPITIYSVVRRVIERVLDKKLRDQIELNCNQRGFVNVPGTHVNSRLVNACLLDAKQKQSDCTVIFLDISKAFDKIGHQHVKRCLEAYGVSANLRRLIGSLLSNNLIRICVGRQRSEPIAIRRSVPQGGPLSPTLFNLATDFVLREACEDGFANEFGYRLVPGRRALSLGAFADDHGVTSSSTENAIRIAELVHDKFSEIGLTVNPKKSTAICIKKGRIAQEEIKLNGEPIRCLQPDERIRYLGCTYTSELVFDSEVVVKLGELMTNLLECPLLQRDQKMTILNQYILPKMTYPLQAAPVNRIPKQHLDLLDKTIRQTARGVIGLPVHNTPNSMLYSARRNRGLGLVCASEEVQLQHFAIASKLERVDDDVFQEIFDANVEKNQCKEALGVEGENPKQLRQAVRDRHFETWSAMDYSGVGVKHFKTYTKANRFVCDKKGLSGSEWVAAIKLTNNYANLAGVPGNSQASSRRCRRCGRETESVSHVLGACDYGTLRRNARHHKVKHALASLLSSKGLRVIDEAPCSDAQGSMRRVDILAIDERSKKAYIVDPTVRFETNADVDKSVRDEKRSIYESCIPDLQRRYGHEDYTYEVFGVWFGARGAVGESALELFDKFDLPKERISEIAVGVISDSVRIIHHHIYGS